jgi:hypothetical protein
MELSEKKGSDYAVGPSDFYRCPKIRVHLSADPVGYHKKQEKLQKNQRLSRFCQRLLQICQRLSSDFQGFPKKSWNIREKRRKIDFFGKKWVKNRKIGIISLFSGKIGAGAGGFWGRPYNAQNGRL